MQTANSNAPWSHPYWLRVMVNVSRSFSEMGKEEPTARPTGGDKSSPRYWVETFKGTPLSIVVPPYIRFLQGTVILYRALKFLRLAKVVAQNSQGELLNAITALEDTKDSKQLRVNFETFFASQLTINLVSEVEHFFGSAVSAALRLYPEKMGSQTLKLSEVLSAASHEEIIDRAASRVLNGLMYEKPFDYLKGLAEILSIETTEVEKHWPQFVELKSRRDIGVHNNWVANGIYLRKVGQLPRDSGPCPAPGTHLIPDFAYLKKAMDSCEKLIEAMVAALGEKWIPLAKPHDTQSS